MITGGDLYSVLCATAPLYFAMLLAYASVQWCHIFTPDQCSGINRFVAAFAVPVLSFHFISSSNPFSIDPRFLLADTLSKLLVLLLLSLSTLLLLRRRRLDWLITLFSLATLPNTLVMGIPLLRAMYGPSTHHLMVQLLVLQCIVWYTLLLFLFEYRAAVLLVRRHFPGPTAAAGISAFDVDGDVISLDGRETILAESEDGRVRVRLSNLSGAEIYSANTPARGSGYASSDAYSLQPTPRASNFNEAEMGLGTPVWGWSPPGGGAAAAWQASPAVLWEFHEGGKDDGGKDASFRSTTKLAVRGEDDDEDGGGGDDQAMPRALIMLRLILLVVGRKLSRNPNTYSSVLGLVWSLVSFRWGISMPLMVTNSIKIISDAGLGMAMFSLGLFMALQPTIIACGAKMAILGMMIRFIGGPLIMSAASMAVGLRGVRLHTAIVQAALPQGIVPFVFAREYGLHPDILSTAVIFGMLVSLPVTLLYYALLGL